jgi:hypothetical protein
MQQVGLVLMELVEEVHDDWQALNDEQQQE